MNQKISRLAAATAITTSLFVSSVFAQDAAPIADTPKAETPTEAPVATTSASAAPVEAPVATTPESAAPAEAPVATATESTVPVETAPVVAAIEAEAPVAEAPKEKASKKKESSFKLTGNVQAQAIKSLYDNDADNTLDNSFLRANIGGKFTSESFEAVINLRIFSPAFGNTIEGKSYDKISADTYYANYKWDTEYGKFNVQFGRFRTDWTVAGNFGTYVDVHLNKRGFLARDYQHDAIAFGFEKGISTFNALLGTYDSKFNTGYIRLEETLKFGDAKIGAAYRVNALDVIQHTAQPTHRAAARASYYFQKNFGLYGEVALIATGDGENLKAPNALKSEYAQDTKYVPFFVGLEIPTAGIFNNVYAELEYVSHRDELNADADNLAWTVSLIKKLGSHSKIQLTAFSEKKTSDVALAARFTATIK